MKNFTFSSKDGHCPECITFGRRYYIQDRSVDSNKYEYALMSVPVEKCKPLKFKNKKEAISWLAGIDMTSDMAISLFISYRKIYECSDAVMLENNGKKFVFTETDSSLMEITDPVQETGWFPGYLECLNMAKEILSNMERKENGGQMK